MRKTELENVGSVRMPLFHHDHYLLRRIGPHDFLCAEKAIATVRSSSTFQPKDKTDFSLDVISLFLNK